MHAIRFRPCVIVCCAILLAAYCQAAAGATLCVNPMGSHACYSSIQAAVNHAAANDVIRVAAGNV